MLHLMSTSAMHMILYAWDLMQLFERVKKAYQKNRDAGCQPLSQQELVAPVIVFINPAAAS